MYDIIIIGGGPAGLTAALYARRAEKKVLVIEKETFGGQITFSPKVENIPGFIELSGNEFAEKMKEADGYIFATSIKAVCVQPSLCGEPFTNNTFIINFSFFIIFT